MAEYLVQDTSLTSVADAIRGKTGASDLLSFPDGYIEAINSIVGEGGGSGGGAEYKTCTVAINGMTSPGVVYTKIDNGQPGISTAITDGVVNNVLCGSVMVFLGAYLSASATSGETEVYSARILYLTPLEEGTSATINLTAD